MCIICTEWQKQKMTSQEAYRAIGEFMISADEKQVAHLMDLSEKIINQEVPNVAKDDEADHAWWKATHKSENE